LASVHVASCRNSAACMARPTHPRGDPLHPRMLHACMHACEMQAEPHSFRLPLQGAIMWMPLWSPSSVEALRCSATALLLHGLLLCRGSLWPPCHLHRALAAAMLWPTPLAMLSSWCPACSKSPYFSLVVSPTEASRTPLQHLRCDLVFLAAHLLTTANVFMLLIASSMPAVSQTCVGLLYREHHGHAEAWCENACSRVVVSSAQL
jgi:hypothetical protein